MSSPDLRSQLGELRRRRFFKVVAVYMVAAWVVIQVAVSTFPYLGLPAWLVTAVIITAIIGFPVALVAAWLWERAGGTPATGRVTAGKLPLLAVSAALVLLSISVVIWRIKARDPSSDNMLAAATLSQTTFSPEIEEFPSFSPDGHRLVFSRETDGFKQLFARDIAGGEDVQLTRERLDHIQASWSPDGRALLFVRGQEPAGKLEPSEVFGLYTRGDVWRFDIASGRTQKIIDDAYNPSYSPDGVRIAFDASYVGPRRIWVADAMGRNPRQVTTDVSEAVSHIMPRWSPNGRLLVFQYIEKSKLDIRAVDVASGKISNITNDLVRDADPVWLPETNDVLFSSARGGGWNLWRIALNTNGTPASAPKQVTTGAGQDLQAAPAANGKNVAFLTLNQNADLWLLPVDPASGMRTGDPVPLIATTREDSRAAWSADGHYIAFNSDRTGDMNLFIYSIGNRSTRQITRGPGGDFQASWAPDSKRLAFFSSRTGSADIWTVDLDQGTLYQLTRDPALDVNPVYSPDGARIAFQSDRGGRKEVWLMNADGSAQRQLTSTGVNDHFMRWSADGMVLLYHGVGAQVMQVTVATGEATLLKEVKGGAHITFAPDDSRIMDVVDHKALWVTPLDGRAPAQVFAFPDADVRIDYPRWSPDGRFVVFDRLKPTGGDIWMLELKR